jgi:hypothetical protein
VTWLLPIAAIALLLSAVLVTRAADAAQQRASLVALELRFPRDQEEAGVQAFLGAVSGLLPPWWRRWWHTPFIAIEVHADHRGTRHRLLVPQTLLRRIEANLAAHLPNVAYTPVESITYEKITSGAEYRLTTADRPLAIDARSLSANLLAALQPLGPDEAVVVQTILAPARPVGPPRLATPEERRNHVSFDEGVVVTSEAVTALKHKRADALLLATLRIGVWAGSIERRRRLLRDVEAGWHGARAPGVMLKRRLLPTDLVARRIVTVAVPLSRWPVLINAGEAAGLVGLPIEATNLPGVTLGGCRPMVVPADVPRHGTIIGEGTHPRSRRPVALDPTARTHHALILGPTGSGKSVLASHLAVHDAARRGSALVVLDPKDGGLVDSVLEQLPEERLRDVIVLDPTDERPVGFDPLRSTSANRELVVDRVLGLMVDIWKDNLGPRSADILRHVLLTIASAPGLTLTEAPLLIVDANFRRRVLTSHDPGLEVSAWWQWVDGMGAAEWSAMTQAPLNKLRAAVGRSAIADTIGQEHPSIDFSQVLREGQILLVRLPVGLLGDETTALLGAMFINQLWNAIAARVSTPKGRHKPASVIIDEVGTVLRFPASSIDTMLTQARGYGVGVTLAAQHLAQLPADIRAAAMTNARTKVIFSCGRDDAAVFARELGNGLTVEDLMGIEAFEAVAAVYAAGRTQAPATIRTLPPATPLRSAEVAKEQSRKRWGVDRADVVAARRARRDLGSIAGDEPIGRRRRSKS